MQLRKIVFKTSLVCTGLVEHLPLHRISLVSVKTQHHGEMRTNLDIFVYYNSV